MLAFHLLNYKITMDPIYGLQVLNHMWATEPVGTTSILLTSLGLIITLSFKLMDFFWDVYKERSRQGRLKVELFAEPTNHGDLSLCTVISNIGKEPIVVRDIGYAKPRLIGTEFIRVQSQDSPLPHALNARELIRIHITEDDADLGQLTQQFRVKDSLGKVWEVPDGEIRKVRRQLKVLKATLAQIQGKPQQTASHALLEHLQASAPISTQN
jgi:hypothetical protein